MLIGAGANCLCRVCRKFALSQGCPLNESAECISSSPLASKRPRDVIYLWQRRRHAARLFTTGEWEKNPTESRRPKPIFDIKRDRPEERNDHQLTVGARIARTQLRSFLRAIITSTPSACADSEGWSEIQKNCRRKWMGI